MPINENMVQEIVQEVMAKMQIADAPTGKHGIFKEMNDAIEAAKKSQLIVKKMSMDQREKIITCIRKKIKENAEVMARMGVEETGMGNVGDKILKHHLVADKTPGTEVITTTAWSGDRGLTLIEMGPFGRCALNDLPRSCGFASKSAFYSAFSKVAGVSPLSYQSRERRKRELQVINELRY